MRRSRDEAGAAPNWAEGGIMYASRVESRCELSKPVSDLWSGAAVDEQQQGARVWVCVSGCVELGGTVVFITKNNARDAKAGENKSWFNGEPVSDTAKKPPPAARERYQNEKKGSFPSCRKVHKVKKCSSCHSSNQS